MVISIDKILNLFHLTVIIDVPVQRILSLLPDIGHACLRQEGTRTMGLLPGGSNWSRKGLRMQQRY
jgi:hypothetical protein